MILVTGAGGQTGRAVIKALVKEGIEVCALVHREGQSEQMLTIGAKKAVAGDMQNPCDFENAMDGADSVYFICSTANPDECAMGRMAVDTAEKAGTKHFIYHSVLREMPHHRQNIWNRKDNCWGSPTMKKQIGNTLALDPTPLAADGTLMNAVNIPAGVRHWHGAAKDSWSVHLT